MLREGNPDYRKALAASSRPELWGQTPGKRSPAPSQEQFHRPSDLCSRASIEGGLPPDTSYDLNDYYMQQIEDAPSMKQANQVSRDMLEDYVSRVRQVRNESGISKSIQSCCDYIQSHISDRLSTKDLAERTGYTEYYFSRKFKQETGCGYPGIHYEREDGAGPRFCCPPPP